MTTTSDPGDQAPPPSASGWTGGKTAGMVLSSLAALIGICILLAGLAVIALHAFARDDDGFYTSDREALRSDAYAITTDRINLDAGVADEIPDDFLGNLRLSAESLEGRPAFIGIGRSGDVQRYLSGVAHSELVDLRGGDPVYEEIPGRAPRSRPASETFWVAQSEGAGKREIDWDAEAGVWTAALLNADASRGIAVEADIGAEIGWLIWIGVGLLVIGGTITATAAVLIAVISRRAARPAPTAPEAVSGRS